MIGLQTPMLSKVNRKDELGLTILYLSIGD